MFSQQIVFKLNESNFSGVKDIYVKMPESLNYEGVCLYLQLLRKNDKGKVKFTLSGLIIKQCYIINEGCFSGTYLLFGFASAFIL